MKDLFQFENFEFHAFKHYLYALKFSNFRDLCPELKTFICSSPLDISGWHVKNWTPSFSPKSLPPPQPLHLSWWSLHPSSLSVQKPWSHPWLFCLIPSIQFVSKFCWFCLQNITFHHVHNFHHHLSYQHLLPRLLPSLVYLYPWFISSPHPTPSQFSRVDSIFLVKGKSEHVTLLFTPLPPCLSRSQSPDKALQDLSPSCPPSSTLASLLPHLTSSTQTSLLFL